MAKHENVIGVTVVIKLCYSVSCRVHRQLHTYAGINEVTLKLAFVTFQILVPTTSASTCRTHMSHASSPTGILGGKGRSQVEKTNVGNKRPVTFEGVLQNIPVLGKCAANFGLKQKNGPDMVAHHLTRALRRQTQMDLSLRSECSTK